MAKRIKKESRMQHAARASACIFLCLCALVSTGSCLRKPPASGSGGGSEQAGGERTITFYGFSVVKEVLEKAIFPGFAAKWKEEHGQDVKFTSSFAGSETITNQILAGVPAEVGLFSIERDVDRLVQTRRPTDNRSFVDANWRETTPQRGIVNKTPFIILVRQGNPKGIRDFSDLAQPGVRLIHPDPVSSGGAMWSILAMYGSELKKSEAEGGRDEARALRMLDAIWANVIATPGSAREARTQFETGYGDALITYELEGLLMKQAGAPFEIIVPESTIFSEHPVVVVNVNVTAEERPVIDAFIEYLWSEEAQRAFVTHHFRSVTDEALNAANPDFAEIRLPFTVEYFGGWARAYPEIIERIWRDQVRKRK
jgi:sulfate/thiosulfate transport system substrate-binding protein